MYEFNSYEAMNMGISHVVGVMGANESLFMLVSYCCLNTTGKSIWVAVTIYPLLLACYDPLLPCDCICKVNLMVLDLYKITLT